MGHPALQDRHQQLEVLEALKILLPDVLTSLPCHMENMQH
jgi:hypothetical protein